MTNIKILPMSRAAAFHIINDAKRILCDIDGCLISGSNVLPGTVDFLNRYGRRVHLVSNNSTDTAVSLSQKLNNLGLMIAPDQIFLAGERALEIAVTQYNVKKAFLLANEMITEAARTRGLDHCEQNPDALMICRDTSLTFEKLQKALHWMHKGLPVFLANRDITHPGQFGLAIETGAIFEMLRSCTEPSQLIEIGKPKSAMLVQALQGIRPENAVMIGDNPETDIEGAKALGIPAIQIGYENGAVACHFTEILEASW